MGLWGFNRRREPSFVNSSAAKIVRKGTIEERDLVDQVVAYNIEARASGPWLNNIGGSCILPFQNNSLRYLAEHELFVHNLDRLSGPLVRLVDVVSEFGGS